MAENRIKSRHSTGDSTGSGNSGISSPATPRKEWMNVPEYIKEHSNKLFPAVLSMMKESSFTFDDEFKKSIRTLKTNTGAKRLEKDGDNTDYSNKLNRYSYLYREGIPQILYANRYIYKAFKTLLTDDEAQWQPLPKTYKLCSMGSGPGTEAIAFQRFLADGPYNWKYGNIDKDTTFTFSGLDKFPEWEGMWEELYDACLESGYVEKGSTDAKQWVSFQFNFWADSDSNSQAAKAIGEADVVIMNMFLSSVYGQKHAPQPAECAATVPEDHKTKFLHQVYLVLKAMKPNSSLIYNDKTIKFCKSLMDEAIAMAIEKGLDIKEIQIPPMPSGGTRFGVELYKENWMQWQKENWATDDMKDDNKPLDIINMETKIFIKRA